MNGRPAFWMAMASGERLYDDRYSMERHELNNQSFVNRQIEIPHFFCWALKWAQPNLVPCSKHAHHWAKRRQKKTKQIRLPEMFQMFHDAKNQQPAYKMKAYQRKHCDLMFWKCRWIESIKVFKIDQLGIAIGTAWGVCVSMPTLTTSGLLLFSD